MKHSNLNKFETKAIRLQMSRTQQAEHSAPLFLTSSFVFDDAQQGEALFAEQLDGNIYSRFTNPNVDEFERKMAALEGMEDCLATSSGMSAIFFSMIALLKQGDHLLISRSVFGNTYKIVNEILPRYGIEASFIDVDKPQHWSSAIQSNSKMIFVETPTNPTLQLVDLQRLAKLGKEHNLLTNVDNCMATPYLQQPAEYGIDIVTHSATKFIDGQGRVLGGAIIANNKIIDSIRKFSRSTGPCLSPFNAWILSKSLETLALRMQRHCDNALLVAKYLEKHPKVNLVYYPQLASHPQYELAQWQMRAGGGLVTFELIDDNAHTLLNQLQLFSLSGNLGDTRSIATHPATTTHSKLSIQEQQLVGITPKLIRLSIGLEHIDDILADLDQAL